MLFGAAGQLGQAMARGLAPDFHVIPLTRRDVDLVDHVAVRSRIIDTAPAVVINCTAYNHVDRAEDEAQAALDVNALVVGTMARAAQETGATFVHFSTDFVFDGKQPAPYVEDDLPDPPGVYGQSKLLGEWLAADAAGHYVLRVESLFGGPEARSSIDRIITALDEGREASVFHDRLVTPSYVEDVVDATRALVRHGAESGVYHCVNTGEASWLDVAREIARQMERPESLLKPVSIADVKLGAPRPQFAGLDNAKLVAAGVPMPTWQDAVGRYLSRRTSASRPS
jgi:dTDP-4-dehydrorhamnose reductase